jgi:hypothetical protein
MIYTMLGNIRGKKRKRKESKKYAGNWQQMVWY